MVLNCAGETRKRDVTTMFTYSHANTPLGQSERAYYLSYFISIINPENCGLILCDIVIIMFLSHGLQVLIFELFLCKKNSS